MTVRGTEAPGENQFSSTPLLHCSSLQYEGTKLSEPLMTPARSSRMAVAMLLVPFAWPKLGCQNADQSILSVSAAAWAARASWPATMAANALAELSSSGRFCLTGG